jgi:hypothetical protein
LRQAADNVFAPDSQTSDYPAYGCLAYLLLPVKHSPLLILC